MYVKPEVESIFTISLTEKIRLTSNITKMLRDVMLDLKEVRYRKLWAFDWHSTILVQVH